MQHTEMRSLLARVQGHIAVVSAAASTDESRAHAAELETSFAALVKHVDVGVAPEVRVCSGCQRTGMREATTCGYCWMKLTPSPSP